LLGKILPDACDRSGHSLAFLLYIDPIFLIPATLYAETVTEIDVAKLFAEKKALVKEGMQLTEKESAVFWPLYDDY